MNNIDYDFFVFDLLDEKRIDNQKEIIDNLENFNVKNKIGFVDLDDKRIVYVKKLLIYNELILSVNEDGEILIDTFKHCFTNKYPYLKMQKSVKHRINLFNYVFYNNELKSLVDEINSKCKSLDKNGDLDWFLSMYPKLSIFNEAFIINVEKMKELIKSDYFTNRS